FSEHQATPNFPKANPNSNIIIDSSSAIANDLALFGHSVRRIDQHFRAQGVVVDWAATAALHLHGRGGPGDIGSSVTVAATSERGGGGGADGDGTGGGDDEDDDEDDDDDDAIEHIVLPDIPAGSPADAHSSPPCSSKKPNLSSHIPTARTRSSNRQQEAPVHQLPPAQIQATPGRSASPISSEASVSTAKPRNSCCSCGRVGVHRYRDREHVDGHLCGTCYNRKLRVEKQRKSEPQEVDEESQETESPKRAATAPLSPGPSKKARQDPRTDSPARITPQEKQTGDVYGLLGAGLS
ncbi:hypothetical protein OC844_007173, partial [Tilletia horrida]